MTHKPSPVCQYIAGVKICDECDTPRRIKWLEERGYTVLAPAEAQRAAHTLRESTDTILELRKTVAWLGKHLEHSQACTKAAIEKKPFPPPETP